MTNDLDLETCARRQLTRLVDHIDVDAPLPVDQPQRTAWLRPTVTVAAGLGLVAGAVIAVGVLDRESQPAVEATGPEPTETAIGPEPTETILWSSGIAPEDWPDEWPPDHCGDDVGCSFLQYASRDGHMVLLGAAYGAGEQVPAAVRLRYAVNGDVNELVIEPTPGEMTRVGQEWSAEVPAHVPS